MQNKLLLQLIRMSKFALFGVLIQCFIITMLMASTGKAQTVKPVSEVYVEIGFENKSLSDVFKAIEKQTKFKFSFYEDLDVKERLTLAKKRQKLSVLLLKISELSHLSFKQVNHVISVKPLKDNIAPAQKIEVIIQTRNITGKVNSFEDGEGLPGVNVVEKGTSNGTVTNIQGEYSLEVAENAILVFSSVGYTQEEVEVGNRSVIDITMTQDIQQLQELVVVGYGTQKKVNLTGAVQSVELDHVDSRPITNLSQALSGLASGVQVTQGGGRPGADGATIRIRGVGTMNNANPLVLIDGIQGSMDQLDPNDIENISVLKDASAAAIYGSRAANGVILITTKRGESGEMNVSYHGYYGWQTPTRLMDYINDHATYMELRNEAIINEGGGPFNDPSFIEEWREGSKDPDNKYIYPNTNWYEYAFGDPTPITNHHLTLNGGTDMASMNLSLGYLDQTGLLDYNSRNRYSVRLNVDSKVSEKISLGANLFGYWENIDYDFNTMETFISNAVYPGVVPRHPDGRYGGSHDGTFAANPYAPLDNQVNNSIIQGFFGKIFAQFDLTEDLAFKTNGAINFRNKRETDMRLPWKLWDFRLEDVVRENNPVITLDEGNNYFNELTLFNTLNYSKVIGKNDISVLLGQSVETHKSEYIQSGIRNIFSATTPVLSAGTEEPNVGGGIEEWAIMSFFGRANYIFDNKYLFEANIRYDGSSRFSKENRWGVFPSFSAGWRVSEENFFPESDLISNFKLRVSWGQLGNQLATSLYPYQNVYDLGAAYNFDGQIVPGVAQTRLSNNNIQWETTTTINAGFDLGLLSDKLNFSFDYFDKFTDDILIQLPIPLFLGDKTPPTRNIGAVRNKGMEFSANYREISGDFKYSIGLNASYITNKVEKYLGGDGRLFNEFIIKEGESLFSIYGYENVGIFQSQEEIDEAAFHAGNTAPGDLQYANLNEEVLLDGEQAITNDDFTNLGNTIPKFIYGMNFNLSYRGFSLSGLFEGVGGVSRYLKGRSVFPFAIGTERGMIPEKWQNRWTPDNPSTEVPRILIPSGTWNYRQSSYWVQNAAYLRLKNLQLGYTLPNEILGLNQIQIYANGQNLLTFTEYEGFDPETNQRQSTVAYPIPKTYTLGVQVTF